MKRNNIARGFTLTELLVVIAVLVVLIALLFPALQRARDGAWRTACLDHLRQINVGVRMYSDDSRDALPSAGGVTNVANLFSGYKELMKGYVGLNGASSSADRLFACPADRFYPSFAATNAVAPWRWVRASLHEQPFLDFSSYVFNGGDNKPRKSKAGSWTPPGLTGRTLGSVKNPSRTVLVTEASALVPWSWHDPIGMKGDARPYNDAKSVASYVDGHVSYVKIFWNSNLLAGGGYSFAFSYDPPAGYDYQWSGD